MRIVVISVDCLRPDPAYQAPRMREFLTGGTHFQQAYAAGPSTFPSVPSYLTGKVAGEHGVIETHFRPRVKTWVEKLSDRGFKTVCYTQNHFTYALRQCFDEWHEMPWLKEDRKFTEDNYDYIWEAIETCHGNAFFYIHLMDVHPPYRLVPGITNDDFPLPVDKYDLNLAMIKAADEGRDLLDEQQWAKLVTLMENEVLLLDSKLEFVGDLVFLMADHGDLVGEKHLGVRRWSHSYKHFSQEQLHILFGYRVAGWRPRLVTLPFCTRFLGDLIFALMDGSLWPIGSGELYWEDYWGGVFDACVKNPTRPEETLVLRSGGSWIYNHEQCTVDQVSRYMLKLLLENMAKHNNHQNLYRTDPQEARGREQQVIVEDRLRALGYL